MLIARAPRRPGQRRIGTRPRSQLQGVTGFSTSNYYRSGAVSGGPQGSATMTVCAFFRGSNATPSVVNQLFARLTASTGGFAMQVVNSSGYARVQVIDGALATQGATNTLLPSLVGTDVLVHGTLTGGQLTCYVNGTAGTPVAVTGYTAAGSVRLGIGISSAATGVQPADTCTIYGIAICDAYALSAAEIAAHVSLCQRARELVAPPSCTYLYHGEDGLEARSTWDSRVGSFALSQAGALTSARKAPSYA